jgi:hypothetical protein
MIGPEVVEASIANHQTPMREIDKARDAREMKTIQGNQEAKNKRNGAEDMMQGGWAANDTMRGGIGQCGVIRG